MSRLVISPHNDDAVLFCAFTIQRQNPRPRVLTIYDSYLQPQRGFSQCDRDRRRMEDVQALETLQTSVMFGGVPDNTDKGAADQIHKAILAVCPVEEVWIPAIEEDGHEQHNLVGRIAMELFARQNVKVHRYLSYTRSNGRSTNGLEVHPELGNHIVKKLRALSYYTSQLDVQPGIGCWPHFLDLREFMLRDDPAAADDPRT